MPTYQQIFLIKTWEMGHSPNISYRWLPWFPVPCSWEHAYKKLKSEIYSLLAARQPVNISWQKNGVI